MKLEKLSGKGVVVLNPEDTINSAIQQMWELDIRHLPVVDHGELIGLVSERDVLFHVCWQEHHEFASGGPGVHVSGATRVDTIMTSPVIALSPQDPVEKAARLMLNERIGAVPLTSGDHAYGIVTETDILKCFVSDDYLMPGPHCRQESVVDHMSSHVFTVSPDAAALTAFRTMRDKRVRHIPVVEHEQVVGIVSDRDILRGGPKDFGKPSISVEELRSEHCLDVRGIMTDTVESLGLAATLEDAAKLMLHYKMGAAPVIDRGKLVGIITETDLLRAFVASCE